MLPYDRKRAFRKQWLYLGTFLTVIFLTVTNLEMVAEVLRSGRKLGAGWTESYILKVLTGDGIRLYFPLLCTVRMRPDLWMNIKVVSINLCWFEKNEKNT